MHGYTSEHLGSRKYHIAPRSIANDTAAPGVASSVELGLLYLRGTSGTKGTPGTSETSSYAWALMDFGLNRVFFPKTPSNRLILTFQVGSDEFEKKSHPLPPLFLPTLFFSGGF